MKRSNTWILDVLIVSLGVIGGVLMIFDMHLFIMYLIGLGIVSCIAIGVSIPIAMMIRKTKFRREIKAMRKKQHDLDIARQQDAERTRDALDNVDTTSPVTYLQDRAQHGNITASNIISMYKKLEVLRLRNDMSVDSLREQYQNRFEALNSLMDFQQDMHQDASLYTMTPDEARSMINKSATALERSLRDDIKQIVDNQTMKAQAAADYLTAESSI
jgi:hypothetical protein